MPRAVVFALLFAAAPARADPESEARALFERGTTALRAGRFPEAEEDLGHSLELHPHPATAFNLAVALRGGGKPLGALRICDRLLHGAYGDLERERRTQAEEICTAAEGEVATLEVEAIGAARVDVRIDGETVATLADGQTVRRRLDPGRHVVSASAADHAGDERTVQISRGTSARVALRVVPIAVEGPRGGSSASPWPWIAGGVAVALGAVVVTALVLSEDEPIPVTNPAFGGTIATLDP